MMTHRQSIIIIWIHSAWDAVQKSAIMLAGVFSGILDIFGVFLIKDLYVDSTLNILV